MYGRCYWCGAVVGLGHKNVIIITEVNGDVSEYLLCDQCVDAVKKVIKPGG